MGCNCGGRGANLSAALPDTKDAPAAPGETWEVTYPNGQVARLNSERQARHAVALAGGSWRHITTGPSRT